MFKITRLMSHLVRKTPNWSKHKIIKSTSSFLLTDEEFDFLINLPKEYNYEEFDNEFYVDRHPSLLEEGISNTDFIEDYRNHLTDKHFVLYEYKKVEDV